jgi:hypothetical protein
MSFKTANVLRTTTARTMSSKSSALVMQVIVRKDLQEVWVS